MSVLLLILGIVLFIALVVVHEFGHFLAARRNGIEVEEFGIGFPPRAWGRKLKNGTLFSLNWLPLGGFVKLKGEHDDDTEPGSFGAASLLAKTKVMLAGVVMNLATAFVLFTLLALIGMPKLIENQFTVASDTKIVRQDVLVGYIEPNSPAEKAGLKLQDKLLLIDQNAPGCLDNLVKGTPSFCYDVGRPYIESSADLVDSTKLYAGRVADVLVERNGEKKGFEITLRTAEEVEASKKTDNPKGYLGISPTEYAVQRSTWSAPIVALGLMKQITAATFKGLGSVISNLFQGKGGEAGQQVTGPVGIVVLLKDGSALGYQFILMFIAIISLTLAIMNVLPVPALDGGRLFLMLIFRALKRPLTRKVEERVVGISFVTLILASILITIVDVRRFF